MTNSLTSTKRNAWRRWCLLLLTMWALSTLLLSFPTIRGIVAIPLYEHQEQANAEMAYVMADGPAYWERLRTASDLYHQKRVQRILILKETKPDGYNFILKRLESRFERSISYLALHGVPRDIISGVEENNDTWFGSLNESRGFARQFPDQKSIVVVTSAPHTRRSKLSFQRSLPNVSVQVYSASLPSESWEIYSPLWIEYAKLAVYFFAA